MPLLLNNCECRDHAGLYPPPPGKDVAAFYDLNRTGTHASKARNLAPGTECIVAALDGTRGIRFDWYSFSHEEVRPAPEGVDVRVLFGTKLNRSVVLPQSEARGTEPYAPFFDINGNLKRGSVIANTP